MMTEILTKQFADAAKESTFIKQAFEGEYPKLLRLHTDLWKRLQQLNAISQTSIEAVVSSQDTCDESTATLMNFRPDQALHATLIPFENAYLSRSLSRLFDSVNVVFSVGSQDAPTKDDVENIIKTIFSELNAANINSTLSQIIAKNVAKTVQLFTVKCEQLITTDGDAIQVIGPPTSSQILNATIVNILYLFHKELSDMLSRYTMFPTETVNIIETSSQSMKTYMRNAVQPILTSVNSSIEAIIATMHKEDFSSSVMEGKTGEACSLYMKELQGFISRAQNDYFSEFPDCDVIQEGIRQLACRAIEYFVRHASLVKPLGDGGKMRLAADFAQMEMAVSPLCNKIGDLGKHYKMLRSFRPLLFQTPSHISQSPVLGEIIPYSIALQFLFSRAPDINSPHEVAGWSIEYYSKWLDEHMSEKERLALIRGTLEAYVQSVRQRQGKEFCQMYPILLQILQQALHHES
ncbi:conserved oligomeric Golgi complex subunit 5-like [Centruroides sculpturatus]|uniref:conserved oligomeric Golgi complex subunit 5-like n=1 Tax=Centruroides sculpturatus TaxID=218467 RepID=UPI000C6E2188|nr:conserved oligomeric Golgi complex subunit 5-like [Centruroides sculpturatus]